MQKFKATVSECKRQASQTSPSGPHCKPTLATVLNEVYQTLCNPKDSQHLQKAIKRENSLQVTASQTTVSLNTVTPSTARSRKWSLYSTLQTIRQDLPRTPCYVYASLGNRRLIYGVLFGCRASVTRSGRDTGVRKPEVGQLIAKRNWALGNANGFCYRSTGEAGLLARRKWKLAAEACYNSVDKLCVPIHPKM